MENKNTIPVLRSRVERKTDREMFPLVEKWLESGERQLDFCARHGFKVCVLSYWLKKYRSQSRSKSEGFVPLSVLTRSSSEIEVCYPNGVKIRAGTGIGADFLRRLAGQC